MASLKEIKNRIGSVKNTQQITKAMKLVSTSKLKKAQDNIIGCRPYAYNIQSLIQNIAQSRHVSHPLFEEKDQSQQPQSQHNSRNPTITTTTITTTAVNNHNHNNRSRNSSVLKKFCMLW